MQVPILFFGCRFVKGDFQACYRALSLTESVISWLLKTSPTDYSVLYLLWQISLKKAIENIWAHRQKKKKKQDEI